jgi:hypothetical protein
MLPFGLAFAAETLWLSIEATVANAKTEAPATTIFFHDFISLVPPRIKI